MSNNRLVHGLYHLGTEQYGRLSSVLGRVLPVQPLVLRIRVTTRCNYHCTFCYQRSSLNKKESSHLSLDEWDRILKHLPPWTIIDVTGGEPFVAHEFRQVMRKILSYGFKTSLITNGSKCTDEDLELLVENKLSYFMISVDGLEQYHNQVRGNARAFSHVSRIFTKLAELKRARGTRFPLTSVKTTLTNENYSELLPLHQLIFNDLKIQNHSLNLMFENPIRGGNELYEEENDRFLLGNGASYAPERVSSIVDAVKSVIEEAARHRRTVTFKPDLHLDDLEAYLRKPADFGVKKCQKMHSVITLYYDGSLTPCDIGIRVGNIRDLDYNLSRVWSTGRFSRFATDFKKRGSFHPACDGCCLAPHQARA